MSQDEEDTVSDWMLERYLLRELPPAQLQWLDGLVQGRTSVADRVAALRRDNAEILARYPPRAVAATVALRRRAVPRTWQLGAVGLAVAAAVVLLALPQDDGTRTKGLGAHLGIHRRTDRGSERLVDGALVEVGDRLQVVFSKGDADHAAVFSLDGAGTVTRHWPTHDDTRVTATTVALGTAFELDDAPAFERFVLVSAEVPIDLRLVEHDLRRVAEGPDPAHDPLHLVKGAAWEDVLLIKPEAR